MANNPKILLAAPTSKYKDYCFDKWKNHVKSLTYNNLEVLIVDNTKDGGEYSKKISSNFNVIHVEPFKNEDNYNLITSCQNIIREFFLYKNYDFLFMLETDQFPPINVIEYFLSLNRRVCALNYFTYTAFQSRLLQFDIEDFGSERKAMCMNLDKTFLVWDGLLKTKYQVGTGCILIHKSILKNIKFRIDKINKSNSHSDVYFHSDLITNNIYCFVSETAMSRHENASWHEILKK